MKEPILAGRDAMSRPSSPARRFWMAGAGALLAVPWLLQPRVARAAPRIGQPAPDFSLPGSDGKTYRLADQHGKIVVLEWSNHECPFVRKHYESRNMQTLQREAAGSGVVWLTIVSSAPGEQGHVQAAHATELTASRSAAPLAVLLDPGGDVGRAYQAQTTPHMYIVSADGNLRYMGGIDSIASTRPGRPGEGQSTVSQCAARSGRRQARHDGGHAPVRLQRQVRRVRPCRALPGPVDAARRRLCGAAALTAGLGWTGRSVRGAAADRAAAAGAAAQREAALALIGAAEAAGFSRGLRRDFADPLRSRWHYVPGAREGLVMARMPPGLQARMLGLLHTALGSSGLAQVRSVMDVAALRRSEAARGHAWLVFGEPAPRGAWGWRLEGHHLSLNFTLLDDAVVSTTPMFLGADPAEVTAGPLRGVAPLFRERYMGRDLARTLTPAQFDRAALPVPITADVRAGPGRAPGPGAAAPDLAGIGFDELTDDTQRHLMLGLAETYLGRLPAGQARAALARLAPGAGSPPLQFAWQGGLEEDDTCYYRLRGARLWLEYATRGRHDHVHTLWRAPGHDFGAESLAAGRAPVPPGAA